MSRKKKIEEEYFTEEMGRNIYVFPPSIGDMHDCSRPTMSDSVVKDSLSRVYGRVDFVYGVPSVRTSRAKDY